MASDTIHEPRELLSAATLDMHRAVVSLMEELEASDWYQQRAQACADPELQQVLNHNRDEEIEHASMLLEWIRRHDPRFDEMLRKYLFSDLPISDHGHAGEARHAGEKSGEKSWMISLR